MSEIVEFPWHPVQEKIQRLREIEVLRWIKYVQHIRQPSAVSIQEDSEEASLMKTLGWGRQPLCKAQR